MRFNINRFRTLLGVLLCLAGLSAGAWAAPRLQYQVTDLGTLPGIANMLPMGLNNHGDVVGMAPNSNGIQRPFLYRAGTTSELRIGDPAGSGMALDINDAGQIVAQATVDGFFHTYLVTPQGTSDLTDQTGLKIYLERMNEAGELVGYVSRGFSGEAVAWSNGVVRRLGLLDENGASFARDINNRGEAVGPEFVNSFPPDPYLFGAFFKDGGITVLGEFGPNAVNDRGEVVGDKLDETGLHAVYYSQGVLRDLGRLPGDIRSWAYDINNEGEIVGTSEDGSENPRAFLVVNGEMLDLTTLLKSHSGWRLLTARRINDRGQIVGVGLFRGREAAYLLTPLGNRAKHRN